MKIAFLGTGIMGCPMAINFVKAGFQVTAWNRTLSKTGPIEEAGGSVAETPSDAGHTEAHRITYARDIGATEFLCKPISAKSLYSRIISIIENERQFVRSEDFFGPDRRRRATGVPKGIEERRRSWAWLKHEH